MTQAESLRTNLTTYAFGILHDWSAAEDVVQEAYLILHEQLHKYDSNRPLFSWIKAIVRNQCFVFMRLRRNEVNMPIADVEKLYHQTFDALWDEETLNGFDRYIPALQSCLSKLPEKSKDYLRHLYGSKQTSQSLAESENRSARGLRVTMCRIRRRLKKCMQEKMGIGPDDQGESITESIDRFLGGSISKKEASELVHRLASSPIARIPFIAYFKLEAAIHCALYEENSRRGIHPLSIDSIIGEQIRTAA